MPVLSTRHISKLGYEIKTAGFTLIADVPPELGGENLGPDPHEYLQVALAGCTAITVQMYAKRKNIPLLSVDVKIEITKEGLENEIRREIQFSGDLSEEQRQALFAIAEKCPIHRFLVRGAKIESHLTAPA